MEVGGHGRFTSGKERKQKAVLTQQPVRTIWKRENSFDPTAIPTADRPARKHSRDIHYATPAPSLSVRSRDRIPVGGAIFYVPAQTSQPANYYRIFPGSKTVGA